MSHALIIDNSQIVGPYIQARMAEAGIVSIDHAWDEKDAIWAVDRRRPRLVVAGHRLEYESALEAARHVTRDGQIPLVVVTENCFDAMQRLRCVGQVNGPLPFSQIESALAMAGVTIVRQAPPGTPRFNPPDQHAPDRQSFEVRNPFSVEARLFPTRPADHDLGQVLKAHWQQLFGHHH